MFNIKYNLTRMNFGHKNHNLISHIQEEEDMPRDFSDTAIMNIFKKSDKSECTNCGEIALFLVTSKVITRVLPKSLLTIAK